MIATVDADGGGATPRSPLTRLALAVKAGDLPADALAGPVNAVALDWLRRWRWFGARQRADRDDLAQQFRLAAFACLARYDGRTEFAFYLSWQFRGAVAIWGRRRRVIRTPAGKADRVAATRAARVASLHAIGRPGSPAYDVPAPAPRPTLDDESRRLVHAAVAALPAPQREVVVRSVMGDEPQQDVAAALGWAKSTAGYHKQKALAALRESLASLDRD